MARNEKAAGTLSWLALALAALVLVGCERSVVDSAPVDISTVQSHYRHMMCNLMI